IETRLIGSTFFARDPNDRTTRRWQQYKLGTGAKGNECNYDMGSGYVATDGKVGVFESGNPNVGLVTKAMDLASCETLWSIESPIGSFRDVWRINTTLVQLSDDGTELMSLVAPK
ncbi:MAG: hypothetical protein QOD90_4554, partial [Mycobacterium sp.]|nr:hypothetical protein [Mycobacterium sp.]